MYNILTIVLFATFSVILAQNPPLRIPEDATLSFIELAKKYLQKGEEYDVTTEDGYILKLFHIPGDKNKPVLLAHGALESADSFIMRGNTSLVATLSRYNYDVWAINQRGNRYSRRHITMNPDLDKQFWDFSFHEYGYYDLPCAVDFILNKTKQQKLDIIGFSEGTTAGYVLGATRPEYNDKINIYISLAPVSYMHNVREYLSELMDIAPVFNAMCLELGIEEIVGDNTTMRDVINSFCLTKTGYQKCLLNGLFLFIGPNAKEIEPEFYPVVIGHFPAGTSRKNLDHYIQVRSRRIFANYNYGYADNILKYNTLNPPKYDLSKVTMKIALLVGKNDRISTIKDVELLRKRLPNVVDYRIMKNDYFNHVDFHWGKTSHKTVYPVILQILNKYQ